MNEPATTDTTDMTEPTTDRPTVEPTVNPEGHPITPNREGVPRSRGKVTDRLCHEKQIRDQLARRRFPNISAKEAQTVCIVRRDFQEKVYGKRGKVRGEAGNA